MSKKILDDTGVSDLVNSIATNIANKYATKDEIITANGGNADTLDGLHADDFAKSVSPRITGDMVFENDSNQNTINAIYSANDTLVFRNLTKDGSSICDVMIGNDGVRIVNSTQNFIIGNGGNADTVNNLRHNEYYADIFSISLTSNHPCWNKKCFVYGQSDNPDGDLYITNAPETFDALWYEVETIGTHDRAYQIAHGCYSFQRKSFIRYMHDNEWSAWRNISDCIEVNNNKAYDANTLFDAGLYLCKEGTNLPHPWGSLLVMPYRKSFGNSIPDYCAQLYITNGDAGIERKMYFRTSKQNSFDEWEEVYSSKNLPTNIPSPNLLINPDFKINQRGADSYTSSAANKYTVDRWIIAGICTQTSSGVTVSSSGSGYGYGVFCQILENYISGQIVTGSAKVNGNIYQFTGNTSETHIGGTVIKDNNNNEVGYVRLVSVDNRNTFEFIIYEGCQMEIEWVKLEIGSVATPFVPPDPASELLKCMRYYEILLPSANDRSVVGYVETSTKAYFDIKFSVPKRYSPTLISDGTARIVVNSLTEYISIINSCAIYQSCIDNYGIVIGTVNPVISSSLNGYIAVTMDAIGSANLAVDAEIY